MALKRVTVSGLLYGAETWANVFHVFAAASATSASIFDAFVHFYDWNSSPNAGVLFPSPGTFASTVGVLAHKITLQDVVDPLIHEERVINRTGGQNVTGGLPIDTSVVISWGTGRAGRSFRGRTYLPPWHENTNEDQAPHFPHPFATRIQGIAAACTDLLNNLELAQAPLHVYSRKLSSEVGGTVSTQIVGGYIDNEWDTQRGRAKKLPKTRTLFST